MAEALIAMEEELGLGTLEWAEAVVQYFRERCMCGEGLWSLFPPALLNLIALCPSIPPLSRILRGHHGGRTIKRKEDISLPQKQGAECPEADAAHRHAQLRHGPSFCNAAQRSRLSIPRGGYLGVCQPSSPLHPPSTPSPPNQGDVGRAASARKLHDQRHQLLAKQRGLDQVGPRAASTAMANSTVTVLSSLSHSPCPRLQRPLQ